MLTQEDKQKLDEAKNDYDEGRYSDALIIFQDLAFSAPTNGYLFFEIAKTYLKMKQAKVGMANFSKTLQLVDAGQHYELQKEYAAMLFGEGLRQEAGLVYQPITVAPSTEEDFVLGLKYLLWEEEIDEIELLLIKNISRFPSAFESLCETTEVESYIIERLRNRRRSIVKTLQNNFRTDIDTIIGQLDFLVKNSEEGTFQHLVTDWDKAEEAFDLANSIEGVVAAKEQLQSIGSIIQNENEKLKAQQVKRKIAVIRQENREKIRELNGLETDLLGLLDKLPATSLKSEIPSYLNVVKSFKTQIRKENLLDVRRAYKNLDHLLVEGKAFYQDGQAAIEKMAAMQAATETGVAKTNTSVSSKTRWGRKKKEEEPVIILESTIKEPRRKRKKGIGNFLSVVLLGLVCVTAYVFYFQEETDVVLITNVFMRSAPDVDSDAVRTDSYKEGDVLEPLSVDGDWQYLRASDGNEGYMLSQYLITPAEYEFIQGIFIDETTKELVKSSYYKSALLKYFIQNEWVSDVGKDVEKKVFGNLDLEREIHMIYGQELTMLYNTVSIENLTGDERKNLACIIRGEQNEQLVIFAFDENNNYTVIGEETLEGIGHKFKYLSANSSREEWYLGDVEFGMKKMRRLTQNALLVKENGCEKILVYDSITQKMEAYKQGSCE